jgi:hypothetical protein
LKAGGYDYDCSTFPTLIGPLARAYYFFHARLDDGQREKRKALFGGLRDGLRPNAPYRWALGSGQLLEIPVTTMPFAKVPIHFSYLHWIAGRSEAIADAWFAAALRTCDLASVAPSLLLHPLDFMGSDDLEALAFFPGMNQSSSMKMNRMQRYLSTLAERYDVEPMASHAARLAAMSLPVRRPDFRSARSKPGQSAHEAVARR